MSINFLTQLHSQKLTCGMSVLDPELRLSSRRHQFGDGEESDWDDLEAAGDAGDDEGLGQLHVSAVERGSGQRGRARNHR